MNPFVRIPVVFLSLLSLPAVLLGEEAVRWAPNLETAKRTAAARNQLVLVHFYGDNCPPCRRLEATVFTQSDFADAVDRDFVPVKINATRDPAAASEFGVNRWPQDVIITPSGQLVTRMISPPEKDRYAAILARIAATKNPLNGSSSSPAENIASFAPPTATLTSATDSPPQQSRFSRFTNQASSTPATAMQNPAPTDVLPSAPQSRFTSAPVDPSQNLNAEQSRFSATSNQSPSSAQAPMYAAQPPADPRTNMVSNQMDRSVQTPPAQSMAPRPEPEQAPKFALDGYSSVTLVEEMKWQKGDPQWGAVHQGQIYLFTSQSEQQRFLADPNRYAPVMAGNDPVAYLGQGKIVEGARQYGLTYRGTVYLFASEQNLQQFWNDPDRYAAMIQQALASQNMRR